MKVYIVRETGADIQGVFANRAQAEARMMSLRATGSICMQEIEVQQPPTWTVWSMPNSAEARSAALNEGYQGDFKVRLQPSGGYIVNVPARDIREALNVGESAFRMHKISNQQENSQ